VGVRYPSVQKREYRYSSYPRKLPLCQRYCVLTVFFSVCPLFFQSKADYNDDNKVIGDDDKDNDDVVVVDGDVDGDDDDDDDDADADDVYSMSSQPVSLYQRSVHLGV